MNDSCKSFIVSSVAWQRMPHGEAIVEVQAAGFGGVEILCKPGHFEPDNHEHMAEVKAALRAWPDAVVTFHTPFYGVDLSSENPDERRRSVDEVKQALGAAAELSAVNATVHNRAAGQKDTAWTNKNALAFRQSLEELTQAAAVLGMTLSVENMPPPRFTVHEDELFELIAGYPPEVVGMCFDTGHAHLAGRVVEIARALAPRAYVAHLHDNSAAERDEHRLPGIGTIPWSDVVDALNAGSFTGHKVIEIVKEETLGNTLEMLKTAIEATGLAALD